MNNARMWLVVNPTVGVPLFLTGVAVGSFAVHVAVLTNTTWVSDFLSGRTLGSSDTAALQGTSSAATVALTDTARVSGASVTAASIETLKNSASPTVLITLPDGTVARAIIQMPIEVAQTAPE